MDHGAVWSEVSRSGGAAVLATTIAVEGHAYRKEGAAMVLRPEGESAGVLSPGCLEDDLRARVPTVLASGLPELVYYDMRPEEDPIWGEAIGCGGRITILLEPLVGELRNLLLEAHGLLEAGRGAVLERRLAGKRIEYRLIRAVEERGADDTAGELLYASAFRPVPRLVLFGAGHDVPPLCALAAKIGFRVVVADWRQGLLSADRFPAASELIAGTPEELANRLNVGSGDYVILCSHQLRRDREMLERMLPASPYYLGLMGSKKRVAVLFEGLKRTPNVSAPVGLDIGADGPEEIAVSIAAELVARKAAAAAAEREVGADAGRGFVFGGGTGEPDGRRQAVR